MRERINVAHVAPEAYRALATLQRYVTGTGLEPSLLELVKIRASYVNGCAYCVDMHTQDARAMGESEQRLVAVAVWRETPFFTPRERAALAWTEAVTSIAAAGVSETLYADTREHFEQKQLVELTMAIATINMWNRVAISFRAEVGSYKRVGAHTPA